MINVDFNNNTKKKEKLIIDKHLPQIILPKDKISMFEEWWNEDIRFQNEIPHAFNEGYFKVELSNDSLLDPTTPKARAIIREIAERYKKSVYEVRDTYIQFFSKLSYITLYFKFLDEEKVLIKLYDTELTYICKTSFSISNTGESTEILHTISEVEFNETRENYKTSATVDYDKILASFYINCIYYWITCMWYLATTTTTIKYYYEQSNKPMQPNKDKDIISVKKYKEIKTPIYDLTKIRFVKVDRLVARRKGWTYSHSFQVHGHYRHYKNGKVIFIESYIKGGDKELKSQIIEIKPKS